MSLRTTRREPGRAMARAAAFSIIAVVSATELAAAAPPPGLRATPPAVDFGERGHMERPSLAVELENTGSEAVRIAAVRPTCSCIEVRPAAIDRPLAPGERVELSVSMASGRAFGRLEKYVEVELTSTGAGTGPPRLRIPVRMRVFDGLRQEPREVRFEGVAGGDPVTRTVDLLWREPPPPRDAAARVPRAMELQVERVALSGPARAGRARDPSSHFSHRVEALASGVRLHLTLAPSHPEGRIAATVRCRLDGKRLEIPIHGEVFRGIVVSPTYLNFNRVDPHDAATLTQESRLRAADGRRFTIRSLRAAVTRSDVPGLRLELSSEPRDGGAGHVIRGRVRVAAPVIPAGSFSGKVLVETDHPEKGRLELGFFGFFPRAR